LSFILLYRNIYFKKFSVSWHDKALSSAQYGKIINLSTILDKKGKKCLVRRTKIQLCYENRNIKRDIEGYEKASKEMDLNEKELVERAIKFYLYVIKEHISLKEELEVWEKASIKDLIDFEMRI
jgi:hypothetical protein